MAKPEEVEKKIAESSEAIEPNMPTLEADASEVGEVELDSDILDEPPESAREMMSAMYAGPLPPPVMLEHYDDVLPGMANRIMLMAENEQNIRGRDNKILLLNDTFRVSGSIIVSIVLVAAAVYCGTIGQPWLGGALVASSALPQVIKRFNGHHKE